MSSAARVRRHKARSAAGIRMISIEVSEADIEALQREGLLPEGEEYYTREEISRAIGEVMFWLRSKTR